MSGFQGGFNFPTDDDSTPADSRRESAKGMDDKRSSKDIFAVKKQSDGYDFEIPDDGDDKAAGHAYMKEGYEPDKIKVDDPPAMEEVKEPQPQQDEQMEQEVDHNQQHSFQQEDTGSGEVVVNAPEANLQYPGYGQDQPDQQQQDDGGAQQQVQWRRYQNPNTNDKSSFLEEIPENQSCSQVTDGTSGYKGIGTNVQVDGAPFNGNPPSFSGGSSSFNGAPQMSHTQYSNNYNTNPMPYRPSTGHTSYQSQPRNHQDGNYQNKFMKNVHKKQKHINRDRLASEINSKIRTKGKKSGLQAYLRNNLKGKNIMQEEIYELKQQEGNGLFSMDRKDKRIGGMVKDELQFLKIEYQKLEQLCIQSKVVLPKISGKIKKPELLSDNDELMKEIATVKRQLLTCIHNRKEEEKQLYYGGQQRNRAPQKPPQAFNTTGQEPKEKLGKAPVGLDHQICEQCRDAMFANIDQNNEFEARDRDLPTIEDSVNTSVVRLQINTLKKIKYGLQMQINQIEQSIVTKQMESEDRGKESYQKLKRARGVLKNLRAKLTDLKIQNGMYYSEEVDPILRQIEVELAREKRLRKEIKGKEQVPTEQVDEKENQVPEGEGEGDGQGEGEGEAEGDVVKEEAPVEKSEEELKAELELKLKGLEDELAMDDQEFEKRVIQKMTDEIQMSNIKLERELKHEFHAKSKELITMKENQIQDLKVEKVMKIQKDISRLKLLMRYTGKK